MSPDDSRPASPIIPRRPYLRPEAERARPAVHETAANVVRGQIDTILQGGARNSPVLQAVQPAEPVKSAGQTDTNPYDRTHQADRTAIHAEQWKRYHSAWQDYYRQYYERYYLGEVYRMRQAVESRLMPASNPSERLTGAKTPDDTADPGEAVFDLKSSLRGKVGTSAVKVRKSRHFVPIMAAAITFLLFMFFGGNYNRIIFANAQAYISPGSIDPANIIIDPTINVPVSSEPKLIIPKINVDVPVIYDTKPDQASQLKAMQNGVAWFGIPGANSRPGQVGNTVLSGHSSNDLFDPGDYKFIFARLEQLDINDTFYINYEGTRYTYSVTKKEVVRPTDVGKLIYDTDKPVVTLITCVPVGTARSRLLVTAEQISPSSSLAKPAPGTSESSNSSAAMPGNSPTFIDRVFGGN